MQPASGLSSRRTAGRPRPTRWDRSRAQNRAPATLRPGWTRGLVQPRNRRQVGPGKWSTRPHWLRMMERFSSRMSVWSPVRNCGTSPPPYFVYCHNQQSQSYFNTGRTAKSSPRRHFLRCSQGDQPISLMLPLRQGLQAMSAAPKAPINCGKDGRTTFSPVSCSNMRGIAWFCTTPPKA